MLKKIMKAALAASLVFGMSSFAYAADIKVGGDAVEYFGMYDKGTGYYSSADANEGSYGANYMNIGEAHVKVNASLGKLSVYHEMEFKTGPSTYYGPTDGDLERSDFKNTQTRVSYPIGPALISVGNVVNIGNVPQSSSGFNTSNIPGSTSYALALSGYSEYEGIQAHIPIGKIGFVQATLRGTTMSYLATPMASTSGRIASAYGTAATNAATAGNLAAAASYAAKAGSYGTYAGAAANLEGLQEQLGANLTFGPVNLRLGWHYAESDDPTVKHDDPMKAYGFLTSVAFYLSKDMKITSDYATGEVSYTLDYDNVKCKIQNIGAVVPAGPGKLTLRYEVTEYSWHTPLKDMTSIHWVYDIPVDAGAGIQIGYASVNTSWGDQLHELGGNWRAGYTQTYSAFGLYARF